MNDTTPHPPPPSPSDAEKEDEEDEDEEEEDMVFVLQDSDDNDDDDDNDDPPCGSVAVEDPVVEVESDTVDANTTRRSEAGPLPTTTTTPTTTPTAPDRVSSSGIAATRRNRTISTAPNVALRVPVPVSHTLRSSPEIIEIPSTSSSGSGSSGSSDDDSLESAPKTTIQEPPLPLPSSSPPPPSSSSLSSRHRSRMSPHSSATTSNLPPTPRNTVLKTNRPTSSSSSSVSLPLSVSFQHQPPPPPPFSPTNTAAPPGISTQQRDYHSLRRPPTRRATAKKTVPTKWNSTTVPTTGMPWSKNGSDGQVGENGIATATNARNNTPTPVRYPTESSPHHGTYTISPPQHHPPPNDHSHPTIPPTTTTSTTTTTEFKPNASNQPSEELPHPQLQLSPPPPPPPTTTTNMEDLVRHCWICHVPLHRVTNNDENDDDKKEEEEEADDDDHHPVRQQQQNDNNNSNNNNNNNNTNNNDNTTMIGASASSLYAMHTHAVLGHVPLCCVCAEDVAAQEQDQSWMAAAATAVDHVSSYCSGCMVSEDEYDGIFFICDTNNKNNSSNSNTDTDINDNDGSGCSREFCFHCVAKIYGGGSSGTAMALALAEDDDQPWMCPCCHSPPQLQSLQQMTMEYYQLQDDDGDHRDTQQQQPRHRLSYLLQQLSRAEDEKEHCEEMLSPVNMERQQLDIRRDIVEAMKGRVDNDMDGLVQMEFDLWYDEWNRHERRISDFISLLLDECDMDHQYTAVMCYQAIGKMTLPCHDSDLGPTATTLTLPTEEDWVRKANQEVDQRIHQRKYLPVQKVLPDIAYETEDFNNVEELEYTASEDGTESTARLRHDGFASFDPRPSQRSIVSAMEHESNVLNVQVKCRISDDQDHNYLYAETVRRSITANDNGVTTSRRYHRRSSGSTSQPSVSQPTRRRIHPTLVEASSKNDNGDNGDSAIGRHRPMLPKQHRDRSTKQNQSQPNVEGLDGPVDVVECSVSEPHTGISESAAAPSPVHMNQFYDCHDDPMDPIPTSTVEMTPPTEPPRTEALSPKNETAVEVMDASHGETPWTTVENESQNGNENVNPGVVTTPSRRLTEATVVCDTTAEHGAGDADLTQTALGLVTNPLSPSKPATSRTISIDTSNKKRGPSGALLQLPSVNDMSSKKKKRTEVQTKTPTRVQDPTLVTHQMELQGQHRPMVLCQKSDAPNKEGIRPIRTIRVTEKLWKPLKPHQIQGVRFMWRNCFADFAYYDKGKSAHCGGCILAHNMGLGKSLSTIALLHTVMTATPSLIRTVLLVVPVNTMANWENEFEIWQKGLPDAVVVSNLGHVDPIGRAKSIKSWSLRGGVLLISDRMFSGIIKHNVQPDVLVLDEAHTMVRNSNTKIYRALTSILTPRRIGLTGSPFQNNLFEYFQLFNFFRPSALGDMDEAKFDREYVKPITSGMASNCSLNEHYTSLTKSKELNDILDPYVHRVDSSELRKELPPMQQVVVHVRQTSLQSKLYRAHKRYQRNINSCNNFFVQFSSLRPVHNHPGSLLFAPPSGLSVTAKKPIDVDDDDWNIETDSDEWWRPTIMKHGESTVKLVANGNKVVLLLHILAYAQLAGDKVVIFSNSLATLDYLEYVLALDWKDHVPSLSSVSPSVSLGRWQKAKEYVRIDGSISGAERGDLVDQFEGDSDVKAFLISKAGGIGINLTKANRIIIFDQHFNPTVAQQAIYRLYRYGQTKPVFCYTLLTQGTTEEKVYGRCVNKMGVAFRVIDKKTIERCFTASELEDLLRNLIWVQCEKCEKWRVLVNEISEQNIAEEWDCSMNIDDEDNNTCNASEKSQAWYEEKYFGNNPTPTPMEPSSRESTQQSQSDTPNTKVLSQGSPNGTKKNIDDETAKLVDNDDVLKHLLDITASGKQQKLICDYYFHDTIMETTQTSDEIENVCRRLNP